MVDLIQIGDMLYYSPTKRLGYILHIYKESLGGVTWYRVEWLNDGMKTLDGEEYIRQYKRDYAILRQQLKNND